MDYDLGYFDLETLVSEPHENPFGPKSVTYVAGTKTGEREVFVSRVECLLAPRKKIRGQ
jgi:hypothetical protein